MATKGDFLAILKRFFLFLSSVRAVLFSGVVKAVLPSLHSLEVFSTLKPPTFHCDAHFLVIPRITEPYKIIPNYEILYQTLIAIVSPLQFPFRFYNLLSQMADNLRRALQDIDLGADDAPIPLPLAMVSQAVAQNRFVIMGRPLMPRRQNMRSLVAAMPRLWGQAGIIHGRIVEGRRFQFVFPSEESLETVLRRGPWAFAERMVVLQRWTPQMPLQMLNFIPFWVQIRGIPFQYMNQDLVAYIGGQLGRLMDVDYDEFAVQQAEYVRVRLNWDVNQPLRFQRNFQFTPGVNTLLRMRYERLRGFCEACGLLTHDSGAFLGNFGGPEDNSDDDGSDHELPPAYHHNQGVHIEEIQEEEPQVEEPLVPNGPINEPEQNGGYVSHIEECTDDPDGYAAARHIAGPSFAMEEREWAYALSPPRDVEQDMYTEASVASVIELGNPNRKRKHEETDDGQHKKAAAQEKGEGSGTNPEDTDDLGGVVGPEPPLPP